MMMMFLIVLGYMYLCALGIAILALGIEVGE